MSLTPMDIHNQEFNTKMRGYDRDEVDSFLDKIVDSFSDALDKNIDLKNENNKLRREINDLNEEIEKYDSIKESLNRSLITAQENADRIESDAQKKAKEILDNAGKDAITKTEDLQDQYETLNNDYDLLKEKVASFRVEIQKVLKDQLKQLDDNTWQYYLDQYYGRNRLYPADGKQPVIPEPDDNFGKDSIDENQPEENFDSESRSNVDNSHFNEVNSVQGSNEKQSKPQPLVGDSPVNEENNTEPEPVKDKGPTIVFPDNYKEHK
ncbi:MAG: DivIVA domain-containing protein [Lactobacillus sp.]|nr:DivIVA domain-containing protein [Lactobacillus sp.]